MKDKTLDTIYMQEALYLARKGEGMVSPNPMVGAVLVKDSRVIGKGYHERCGEAHAEINAIKSAAESIDNATLYVTLEPCCHTNKKTPPCTEALKDLPLKRIVVGALDPNPEVAGKGVDYLRNQGFKVDVGVLANDCHELNAAFEKFIVEKKSYVHLKLAQTLDGKMVTSSGSSKWITDEDARKKVHELRFKYDAVVIGKETLINDNPSLTIRYGLDKGKVPWRIVIGDPAGLETHYNLFNDKYVSKTMMVFRKRKYSVTEEAKIKLLEERGVKFVPVSGEGNWLKPSEILTALASEKIGSILIEGGPTLLTQFIEAKEYDKLSIFIAPKVIGNGRSFFESDTENMEEALSLRNPRYEMINNQIIIEAEGLN
jgi:diaminohydroxyphosphoribosylaminopyrimidine deaminase / 5-amino-6-(5-phosphoribosylamino)uracil reductase